MKKQRVLSPISMFLCGMLLGVVSRLLDIYTQNFGNIFSQFAIWILLGTLIAIYSKTKKKAMVNVLLFCIGMLITYYAVAIITKGIYSNIFIIGWTVFAFVCPVLAFFTWMTKEQGVFPKIISVGIVLFSVVSTILMFDRLRVYDYIINAILIYILIFKKVKR